MANNGSEQVEEPPSDALTFSLTRDGDMWSGTITCSPSAAPGRLIKAFHNFKMPLKEAFRASIKVADDFKVPMVVVDPDLRWQPGWGTLYREEDDV